MCKPIVPQWNPDSVPGSLKNLPVNKYNIRTQSGFNRVSADREHHRVNIELNTATD